MKLIDADALRQAILSIMPERSEVLLIVDSQPEGIVRCKDCKHWREGTAFSYCDKLYGMGVLDALDYMVAEDDYCSMAERRGEQDG